MAQKTCRECRLLDEPRRWCGVTIREGRRRFRLEVLPEEGCCWQAAKRAITAGEEGASTARALVFTTRPTVEVGNAEPGAVDRPRE